MDVAGWRGGATNLCPGQQRTPNPVFKVTAFLKSNISNISKMVLATDTVTIEH